MTTKSMSVTEKKVQAAVSKMHHEMVAFYEDHPGAYTHPKFAEFLNTKEEELHKRLTKENLSNLDIQGATVEFLKAFKSACKKYHDQQRAKSGEADPGSGQGSRKPSGSKAVEMARRNREDYIGPSEPIYSRDDVPSYRSQHRKDGV